MVEAFQALSLQYSVTNQTSGQTINYTSTMVVVSDPLAIYIVNVTSSSTGNQNHTAEYQFKVDASGAVEWAYYKFGAYVSNVTGTEAVSVFQGAMGFFELELATNQVYSYALLTQYFQQVGGQNTVGLSNLATGQNVNIDYYTYGLNSANETFGYCGSSLQFSQFTVWIGTIRGTSTQVLAKYALVGTINGNPADFSVTLTWVWPEP